jgi:hypothetical protein
MNKTLIFIILTLSTCTINAQNYNVKYGKPVIALIETNPWLMVIGSDVPTFALYENGQIIYKKVSNNKTSYFEIKFSKEKINQFIEKLGINDSLKNLPENINASYSTYQPTNQLILNFDSVKLVSVYGSLRSPRSEDRQNTPSSFLKVYDNITNFKDNSAKQWLPDSIEVMLTDYSHSPEKPLKWPNDWPNLKNGQTVKRGESLYSVYLGNKQFDRFIKFIKMLKEKQAVEINGKKFSMSYRLPFPNFR